MTSSDGDGYSVAYRCQCTYRLDVTLTAQTTRMNYSATGPTGGLFEVRTLALQKQPWLPASGGA